MFEDQTIPNLPDDPVVANVRKPPQSIESEQSVLGGIMLDGNAYDLVSDILSIDDFYRPEHRLVFEIAQKLALEAKPIDVVTVFGELQAQGRAQDAGGIAYLNQLVNAVPAAANVRRYAEIVRERSILRALIRAGDEIATMALSPEAANVPDLLDHVQSLVFAIDEKSQRGNRTFRKLPELAGAVTSEIQQLYQMHNPDDVTGIPTSFTKLDRMLTGLQKGDLIIVAGRPSMGKTSLALNFAEHIGFNLGLPVAIFSMEMSAEQLTKRFISSIGRIDAQKIRRGRLDDNDWASFTQAVGRMAKAPVYIDDTPGLTINELRGRARRLIRTSGPLSLVVVDYLQLMSGTTRGNSSENRATEISEISRGLKTLAKELDVPVIALSQLNRSVDNRPDKRPVMSDLRESGAIEQDADVIMFIYRDVVYNKDTPTPNEAEVIVSKQRNGPTGIIPMRFDGEFTRFDNLAEDAELPAEYKE